MTVSAPAALDEARRDPARFRSETIHRLVREAVFGDSKDEARLTIRRAAAALGILPASIHPLYMAMGRGEVGGFTTPAINIRCLTYESARAVFRAARKIDAGAFIFEIARSEMGYTDQRPAEYAACVLAAAIKEGHEGPVFIQGDHFQLNAKKYAVDPDKERRTIEDLVEEAIPAGFFNIDIDSSTLVDLSKETIPEQQLVNSREAARITAFIRAREPQGVTISVGGEIGEVGKNNSTPEEFRAYMDGYLALLPAGMVGVSKISINTGSSHGGIVLPDGTVKRVAIDFPAMKAISEVARAEYGLSGAVQHGASTLPPEYFDQFPKHGASEVHLATEFQNMTYERLPDALREEMYAWVKANAADERKQDDTDEQFLYRSRKKAIGPFKQAVWDLPEGARAEVGAALEERFSFLFEKLNVGGTRAAVLRYVSPVEVDVAMAGAGAFHRDDEAGD